MPRVRRVSSSSPPPKRAVTLWHDIFASLMIERAPEGFEVRSEVKLVPQSARVDLLLLRRVKAGVSDQAHKSQQREPSPAPTPRSPIMRGLWPRLPLVSIVEYKSPSRGVRRDDLLRLVEYGTRYMAANRKHLPKRRDLGLVLVAPRDSDGLQRDLDYLGWRLRRLGNGYATLEDAWYTGFVGFTDEICEAEHDDFLRIFSNTPLQTHDVANWLRYWMTEKHDMRDIRHREGFDSISDKFLDMFTPEERLSGLAPEQRLAGLAPEQRLAGLAPQERLAGLAPEQRLAGLAPEQRLTDLSPEQSVLALPVQVLRALSEEYIASLPDEVQSEVRARLADANTAR